MKKIVVCGLLLWGAWLSIAAEGNLVKNPDFAKTYAQGTKAENWSLNSKKDTGVFTPTQEGGVLKLNANNKHTALLQEIPLKPYTGTMDLEMSFSYKGTIKRINGSLHATDATGKELKIKCRSCQAVPAADFQKISSRFQIPEGAVKLRVALRAYGEGTVTFTDVQLSPATADKK